MSDNVPAASAGIALGAAPKPRGERGFWALILTQFQGAFSDNVLRNLLLAMVVGMGLAGVERDRFVSIVTFLFGLPFVLFSMTGGWLADRFSKRQVTIWTKVMEIASMIVATVGLGLHWRLLSLIALGLVATQAALFGPSKYGLLPELLPAKRLSWGNGVIELGTFLGSSAHLVNQGRHFADGIFGGKRRAALAFSG
jgi:MFS family permease